MLFFIKSYRNNLLAVSAAIIAVHYDNQITGDRKREFPADFLNSNNHKSINLWFITAARLPRWISVFLHLSMQQKL